MVRNLKIETGIEIGNGNGIVIRIGIQIGIRIGNGNGIQIGIQIGETLRPF